MIWKTNVNDYESNESKEQNNNAFFDYAKENDKESGINCLMISKNVDFQISNDLLVLLKHWYDGDEKEVIIRPLSSLTATEKKYLKWETDPQDTKQ